MKTLEHQVQADDFELRHFRPVGLSSFLSELRGELATFSVLLHVARRSPPG